MAGLGSIKMTYALNLDGEIVSVDDVANGLNCDCRCVECLGRLTAKQGEINRWHFSHNQDATEINCQWSGESEIHLKVKEFLEHNKVLTVPMGFTNPTSFTVQFDEIQLEKSLRTIKRIPDVTGYCAGEKIHIEVKVTHEVDQQKKSEYKRANVSVIELDFSHFKPKGDRVTFEDIEAHLLNEGVCAWLTVAPVGDIACRFQEHERAITKELIKESNLQLRNYKHLTNEAAYIADYINAYRPRFERCQLEIKTVTDRLSELRRERYEVKKERDSNIHAAESSFLNTVQQLERDHLIKLDNRNIAILERLREDFVAELNNTYHERIAEIQTLDIQIQNKQVEHLQIQQAIEQYDSKASALLASEERLKAQKLEFQQREQEWNRAARANAVIKRHFIRLEPELRMICRKGGIPWPFKDSLLSELSPDDPDPITDQ
ncbi:competence protein CoiA family protein [Shewanella algicola]|uniref:competence protein CoiA family protein n=1 Tax=Shewanella algicola TaxID=640633 RepID=UPI00249512AA|nr:competence protein CoiA family protein [Shewanella algicola]